jgi:hypothetical protein
MEDPYDRPFQPLYFDFHNIPNTDEQCGYILGPTRNQCIKCGWKRDPSK